MNNFPIHFAYPWLLLLIPVAIGVALIPYFMLDKKYRRTRNRVVSIVLHSVIMTLVICVLAGITFVFEEPNIENEILLLVDVSDTLQESKERRDEFVETVLHDGKYDHYKMGVVTFGFDQNYAVPLTNDVDRIYRQYINAELPDTQATDIAAALMFAKDLFTNPDTAKIVLVTDGKETDERALSAIRSVAALGIKVDTAYISSSFEQSDMQIVGIELPDYHVNPKEECEIKVTVHSNISGDARISLYDNGQLSNVTGTADYEISASSQTFTFKHMFEDEGLHELEFRLAPESSSNDYFDENNNYHSYLYLEKYDNILVLEGITGYSTELEDFLKVEGKFNVTNLSLELGENIPNTIEDLCQYDQIVMSNVANADLPKGFDELLYEYVYEYGGGLFTVGGDDKEGNAHAYNRSDMYGTLYQQMLPVQAINYTPPVGVMVIIDTSGSMSADANMGDGLTRLDWAKYSLSTLFGDASDVLTERDYFGLMILNTTYDTVLPLTPRSQESKIISAINSLGDTNGSTNFAPAIDRAGQALRAQKDVDKRHIIIISDGQAFDQEDYEYQVNQYYQSDKITLSVALIGERENSEAAKMMQRAVELGHGRLHVVGNDMGQLSNQLRSDLAAPEIKDVNVETFNPMVSDSFSPLVQNVERKPESDTRMINATLDGFYGAKIKTAADLILAGDYDVPIYAQWKFGNGMVGSFLSDLNGKWSADFMSSNAGKTFLLNAVNNLLPVSNIRPKGLNVVLNSENYINQLSIYADLNQGEQINGRIVDLNNNEVTSLNSITVAPDGTTLSELPCYVTLSLNADNGFSRSNFVIRQSGVYRIELEKVDANGNVLATYETYKAFAYSKEYGITEEISEEDLTTKLALLAVNGNGAVVEDLNDPKEVFANFITSFITTFDPRIVFIVIAMVLFLLDIAVRKFKFKWPHELIREYRNKKSSDK